MLKNDRWIRKMAKSKGLIEPFEASLVQKGKVSYGLSSYGYDFRLADEFLLFQPPPFQSHVDPKKTRKESYTCFTNPQCFIPPHGFVLGRSLEYFRIPRDIIGLCMGKSTYSRCGILVNITPLEPQWEGHITFPILNSTPFPVRIYPGEGIAQVLFFEGLSPEVSYADRKGKYQAQKAITLSRV